MSTAVEVLVGLAAVGGVSALCLWGAARLRPPVELTPEEQVALAERQQREREARRQRRR